MIRKTAHIVMAFNKRGVAYARFNAIGVNSALNKIIHLAYFFSLRLEHTDKLPADYLALLLRLAYTAKLAQKLLGRVNRHKVYIISTPEQIVYLLCLVLSKQTVVNKYAGKVFSYRLVQKQSCNRAVYPAGKRTKHLFIPYFIFKLLNCSGCK